MRQCWTISGEESLDFLRGYGNWQGLQTIAKAQRRKAGWNEHYLLKVSGVT